VKKQASVKELKAKIISPARHMVVLAMMLSVGGFLSYRALDIQVLDNDFLQKQGDARHLRTINLPAHRGMLLDRNGEVLAVSSPVATVWANPQAVPLNDPRLDQLSDLIDVSVRNIKAAVNQKQSREFVYLQRHLNPHLGEDVKKLNIPGISLVREFHRYYPTGEVSAHVLGFTDIDDQGIEGMELQFNNALKGIQGKDKVVKDRKGHIIDSVDLLESPQPGQNIHVSIDKRLQYIAYRELKKQVQAHSAKTGSLVLLDVHSGEVLAMVNEPAYNPNNREGSTQKVMRNRALTDLLEPGSTIKPFIAAAALMSRQFSAHTPVQTSPGYMRVGRNTIRDVHNYGDLDLSGVIKKSSNVGISKVALALPKEMLWEVLSDMGFGEISNSHFPGEVQGVLPFFGEWNEFQQATLSFGYGISVTPVQLAQAYAMLANGGVLKPVSLLKLDAEPQGKQAIPEDVAQDVMHMMESVVSREGTAVQAAIPGYRVAGKTGTIKKLDKINGGYMAKNYYALFAGVVPASEPRLAAVVVIDDPTENGYYGGTVAAPVFSRVLSEALRLMDIPPDDIKQAPVRVAQLQGATQ